MLYHARALAANGVDGTRRIRGTPLPKAVAGDPRITVRRLNPAMLRRRGVFSGAGYAVAGLLDAARLSVRLWLTLTLRDGSRLVQNPPAFPTLAVTWFRSGGRCPVRHRLAQPRLHAAAAAPGPLALAVRLARWLERRDARRADANLCVSRGLAGFLESASACSTRGCSTIGPRPRSSRWSTSVSSCGRRCSRGSASRPDRRFHRLSDGLGRGRGFDLVIDAVPRIEERIRGWEAAHPDERFADLVILVTGDGARRAEFERRFAGLPRGGPDARTLARAARIIRRCGQCRPRLCLIGRRPASTSR